MAGSSEWAASEASEISNSEREMKPYGTCPRCSDVRGVMETNSGHWWCEWCGSKWTAESLIVEAVEGKTTCRVCARGGPCAMHDESVRRTTTPKVGIEHRGEYVEEPLLDSTTTTTPCCGGNDEHDPDCAVTTTTLAALDADDPDVPAYVVRNLLRTAVAKELADLRAERNQLAELNDFHKGLVREHAAEVERMRAERDELIDTLVDHWHDSRILERDSMTLPEWLGWTKEQYAAWVEGR